jgi:hypothetical protein
MRILFVARHYTYFRNYDSALRDLASHGHEIHLAVQMSDAMGGQQAIQALTEQYPTITHGVFPDDEPDEWRDLSRRLRLGLDYLRYLDDFYDDAPLRRVRARERTPQALIRLAEPPTGGGPAWRQRVGRWLHALDQSIEPPSTVVEFPCPTAGRAAHHAARRSGFAADRLPAGRPRARDPDGPVCVELGSPVEQGVPA